MLWHRLGQQRWHSRREGGRAKSIEQATCGPNPNKTWIQTCRFSLFLWHLETVRNISVLEASECVWRLSLPPYLNAPPEYQPFTFFGSQKWLVPWGASAFELICALVCRLAQGWMFFWNKIESWNHQWYWLWCGASLPKCMEIFQGQHFATLPWKLYLRIEELCFATKPATNLGYVGPRGRAIWYTAKGKILLVGLSAVQFSHQETNDDGYGTKTTCVFQAQASFNRFVDKHLRQK